MKRINLNNSRSETNGLSRTSLRRHHRALALALGLAILTALAVSDHSHKLTADQGFSDTPSTDIFIPETVRIEGT